MRKALKAKKKKLRNGPIIEIHPQILRWKAARKARLDDDKKYKKLREAFGIFTYGSLPIQSDKEEAPTTLALDPWKLFK